VPQRQASETHSERDDRRGRGNEIPVEAGEARIVVDEPEGAPGGVAVGADGSAAFDEKSRVARLVEKEVLETIQVVMGRRGDSEEEEDEVDPHGTTTPGPEHGQHYTPLSGCRTIA